MSRINKVISTVWYNKENYHKLRNVFPQADFVYVDFYDKDRLIREARDADVAIVLGDVDNCLLGENSLKWIACDHAGLNGSAREEVFAKNIIVTGAAGRSAPVLAEHAIYFMLQYCYHTKELLAAQEEGRWGVKGSANWFGLYGRKTGIIGFGNTGKMLADRLNALGMEVYAYNRSPIEGYDYLKEKVIAKQGGSIDSVIKECDFVILTLPLTDDTYHMFNKDTFLKMKDNSFLVNMSRGGIVNTEDLTWAIREGIIGGAGLDVIEEDPLPSDHPLWRLPTVYITPHTTPQVPNRAGRSIEIIRENARRFEAGEPMLNQMTRRDQFGTAQKGGFSRLLEVKLTPAEAAKLPLEQYLGKKDWKDQSEWDSIDPE